MSQEGIFILPSILKCSCQLRWKAFYSQAQGKNIFIFICRGKKMPQHTLYLLLRVLFNTQEVKGKQKYSQGMLSPKGTGSGK